MRQVLVALVGLTSCDWDGNRMNDQARCEAGDSRPWRPDHRCDQPAPPGTVPWQTPPAQPEPAATRASIQRGRDRFARFCAPCHGPLADGNSVIAQDMVLRRPPSLLIAPVIDYPDQRIFEVITAGYGLMPSYSYQLPAADRWAVVQFLRVLQSSQRFPITELTPHHREEAAPWLR